MAISYPQIAKAVLLRANQIKGGDSTARETAYSNADISTQLDGVELPYSALKDTVLATEKEIAEMVGNDKNSFYRASIESRSVDLVSGASIPNQNNAGTEFIGSISGFFDATNNRILTEQPKQTVQNRNENAGNFFKRQSYHWHIEGDVLVHTRLAVYVKGVAWNYATQSAAFDARQSSPLPQSLENYWIAMVLSQLPQEQWFVSEATYYTNLVQQKTQAMIDGKAVSLTLPSVPDSTQNAQKATN